MKIILRLLGFVKNHWVLLVVVIICLAIERLLEMVFPWLIKWTIDNVIGEHNVGLLKQIIALAVITALGRFGFAIIHRISIAKLVQKVIFDLRNVLYDSLQRLSFSYHDQAQTGQLMSRVTSDVQNVHHFVRFGLVNSLQIVSTFTAALVIMLRLNVQLTLICLVILPLIILVVTRFANIIRPLYYDIRQQYGAMTNVIQENILGVKVVKSFTREDFETEKFDRITKKLIDQRIQTVRLHAKYMPAIEFLVGTGTVIILLVGGYQVINGQMSVGELVAFNSYFFMIAMPVRHVGRIVNIAQRTIAAGQRIYEILDEEQEIQSRKDGLHLDSLEGSIEFHDVSFDYGSDLPVLEHINLKIKPGETIALVGPTGSGKSTIANLIPRFYDVSSGAVLIDGHNVKDLRLWHLRHQIGLVFQETFLYSASVAENIAYGKRDACREDIVKAAQLAQIHDFIETLSEGYDTVIGERGVDLSGGQKQRISIARALLTDPRILILDDSTSSVDVETEYSLQEALQSVLKDRTNIIIAHRFSSIKHANRIIVMDQGRIVEEGTHASLMEADRLYKKIYSIQFEQTGGTA
jgi:ATP-binding cassette subfamily B protein